MKSLERFDNIDRAKLLYELFPEEIEKLVLFIEGMCHSVLEDRTRTAQKWDNQIFSLELWLSWAEKVRDNIERYRDRLHRNKRLFTDQLFDGYIACFTNHCIEVYVSVIAHPNDRFAHAVQMLYNFNIKQNIQ